MTSAVKLDDLPENHRNFIDEYIKRGGSRTAATEAVMAVYGYDRKTATVYANRLLKHKNILAVLRDLTIASFAPAAVAANEQLVEILTTGMWHGQKVKPSDGLKVIKEVLERGIGPVVHKSELEVHDNRSLQEVKAAIVQKLENLSPEDRALIVGRLGGAIDVEVAEVGGIDPEAPWGRKVDGAPKEKTGRKGKRLLPGPDAHRPRSVMTVADLKARVKERKRLQMENAREARSGN